MNNAQSGDEKYPWRVACVVPVYNNGGTLRGVVERCREQKSVEYVLVVDDGSTDCDVAGMLSGLDGVKVIRHGRNMGKGRALRTALEHLAADGIDYMITLDGDGQHYPEDIPLFLEAVKDNDHTLAIGVRDMSAPHIPEGSRKGRAFSNFWVRVETGREVGDAQSGFRAYPVRYVSRLKFLCGSYDFEAEVLVRSIWGGVEPKDVPIRVWYPEKGEKRVTSFKPFLDNLRFTLINAHLVGLRLLPIPHKRLVPVDVSKSDTSEQLRLFMNPLKLVKMLLAEHATPGGLAAAAAVGTFLAVIPIPGFHSVAIIYAATRLHLNRLMAFNIQHFFMPPLSPFLCLETGYFMMHGRFLTEVSFRTVLAEIHLRFFEWLVGSLLLAPLFSVTVGVIVYACASYLTSRGRSDV